MITFAGLGFIKVSVVALYLRIFSTRVFSIFQVIGKIMVGVIAVWAISFFFASIFQCVPVTALVGLVEGEKCVNIDVFYNAGCYTDIVVDFLILALPIPKVLKLRLSLRQRLSILGIFFLGTVATVCSVARLVIYYQVDKDLMLHPTDGTYYMSSVFIVTVVELDLAVISACLPTLRPLLTTFFASKKEEEHTAFQQSSFSKHYPSSSGAEGAYDDLELPVLGQRDSA